MRHLDTGDHMESGRRSGRLGVVKDVNTVQCSNASQDVLSSLRSL